MIPFISWIFPPKCASCGEVTSSDDELFCQACKELLFENNKIIFRNGVNFISPFLYYQSGRSAVLVLKRVSEKRIVDFFAAAVAKQFRCHFNQTPDIVACVPMTSQKRRKRGFNQAEILARKVAELLKCDFSRTALRQIRPTKTQHSLSFEERHLNVEDAYIAEKAEVSGKRVLLIDDIITTGATVYECIKALKAAGATKIIAASAAATGIKRR